jgi:hypothetical protein
LATREVYSEHLPPYWPHVRYILSICRPIGLRSSGHGPLNVH